MGEAKAESIRQEGQGFDDPPQKNVCVNHVTDDALRSYVSSKVYSGICDYCGANTKVFLLHELVKRIAEKVNMTYTDIANEAGYDSSIWQEDGEEDDGLTHANGYILPGNRRDYDSEELFETLELYKNLNDENLYNDIVHCFPQDKQWCERDVYGTRIDEEMSFKWRIFCEEVKHRRRYTFFQNPDFDNPQKSDNGLSDILNEVSRVVRQTNLIRTIPAGTKVYRCRNHNRDTTVDKATDLVSPLPKQAIYPNRMSPAGIPMFYCGFDSEVVRDEAQGASECQTVGEFELKESMVVIDFTHLPKDVSFWGDVPLEPIRFLHSFVSELSKPIRSGDEHIEYVPTQILTEHFRYNFIHEGVRGMIYESAKCKDKSCCVLFLNQEECLMKMKLTLRLK